MVFLASSLARMKFRLCLAMNLSWEATLSGEMPMMMVSLFLNSSAFSARAIACLVQPGVRSFG